MIPNDLPGEWAWHAGLLFGAGGVAYSPPERLFHEGPFTNPARMCEERDDMQGVWRCAGWWDG